MPGIFISYRRIDSKPYSGRLFDRLRRRFGRESVFMDIEGGISPGEDFGKAIERAVNSVDAMVVVIGREWLACTDKQGRRRLDSPEDWVRGEVAAALRRGIFLLPVLVDGATLPLKEELPEEIGGLAVKQKHEITDTRWDYDVAQIFRELEKVVPPRPETDDQPSPWPRRLKRFARWVGWGVLGVLALIAAAVTVSVLTEQRQGDYDLTVDPPQIRFEWDGRSTASESIDIKVTNTGRKKANIEFSLSFSQTLPSGVVMIKDDTCKNQTVAPGAGCSARVTFEAKWFESDESRRRIEGQLWVGVLGKWHTATPLYIHRTTTQ